MCPISSIPLLPSFFCCCLSPSFCLFVCLFVFSPILPLDFLLPPFVHFPFSLRSGIHLIHVFSPWTVINKGKVVRILSYPFCISAIQYSKFSSFMNTNSWRQDWKKKLMLVLQNVVQFDSDDSSFLKVIWTPIYRPRSPSVCSISSRWWYMIVCGWQRSSFLSMHAVLTTIQTSISRRFTTFAKASQGPQLQCFTSGLPMIHTCNLISLWF